MVFKPNKTVNENKTKYSMKSATEFLIACIRIAVIPKHLMQLNTFVRSLELQLEVCSSISYWLFDLNNTVVVYRGEIAKTVSLSTVTDLTILNIE